MIHVLKHVESITQHRDRTLLELGVASALFELVKAREVNLYKAVMHGDDHYLSRVTHVGQDGVRYVQSEFDEGGEAVPLHTRPKWSPVSSRARSSCSTPSNAASTCTVSRSA